MTSPHQFAPRCRAKRRGERMGKEGGRVAAMCRKACFPAPNGVRQYMRAGRPYCLSHGGNDAAGRCAKTPKRQRRHTVARYARPPPLRRSLSPFSSLYSFLVAGIKGKLTFKEGGRATLPAFGRRLICDGVRGDAPQINRCRGRQLFARWGGEIYPAPPACKIRVGAAVCR